MFPPMPLMTALDADGDGKISTAEMENAALALKKLDKNNDGELSREEMRPSFRGGPDRPGPGGERPEGAPRGPDDAGSYRRDAGATREGPPRGPDEVGASITETAAAGKDETEKKILTVLDDMDRRQRSGMMNVPVKDGRLLRLLAETIGAKQIVEVGTSNGYSGIWQCLALLKTGGKLTTFEMDAKRAALARDNFKKAGVDKMVTLVEGDAHQEVTKFNQPIDMLFLDADKEGYIDYLNKLLKLVRPGGIIVAHNINPRQADPAYIKAVTTNTELETLFFSGEGSGGVSLTLKKR